MKRILTSLLEVDFYKLPMQQVAYFQFPEIEARYELILRRPIQFPSGFAERLREQIQAMGDLMVSKEEIEFLRRRAGFLKESYLEYLAGYRFNPNEIHIEQNGSDLKVAGEALWYRLMPWETSLMSIICELYYQMMDLKPQPGWGASASQNAWLLREAGVNWADFGLRRAFSRQVHRLVLQQAMEYQQQNQYPGGLVGTSCVSLAIENDLRPIGTIGHEQEMVLAACNGYPIASQMVLDAWMKEFKGRLGTALPDTYTTEVFLRNFTAEHAKAYDGLRQDSGDPCRFVDKVVAHYKSLGIDPLTKTIVFSDRLNVTKMIELNEFCRGKIKASFGWGTGFTNNVGHLPLDIVVKVTAARPNNRHPWLPAVKLSDDPNKATNNEVATAVKLLLGI